MGIFETMRIAMTGLTAQRLRMDVISSNIANVETTRTPEGGPYLRRQVIFQAELGTRLARAAGTGPTADPTSPATGRGVSVAGITADPTAVRRAYNPNHPDADADGYVTYPDIDVVTEMTDMLAASRAYEANVTVLNAIKGMAVRALSIGRA